MSASSSAALTGVISFQTAPVLFESLHLAFISSSFGLKSSGAFETNWNSDQSRR